MNLHHLEIFWAAAGFMAGIAAAFIAARLWRSKQRLWALGGVSLVMVMCFALYLWTGNRESLAVNAGVTETPHAASGEATPGNMEDAANRLAARLAIGQGSDRDWELLAQTYEFLGDTDAAQLARQHQVRPGIAAAPGEDPATRLRHYQQQIAAQPGNASAWLGIAQLQRDARDFAAARRAYEQLIELDAMNADTWADYADVCASMGSLSDPNVRRAIDAALLLDPEHLKALWLHGSVAHAQQRHAEAAAAWRRLLAVLPAESADVAVIQANLEEDARLSGAVRPLQTAVTSAQLQGMVELDPAVRGQATPDMTLFIFAKAEDSPAPVAAYRTSAANWPVDFLLDDSHAMMPARKLSMYSKVQLQARLSRSGQAMAAAGDLQSGVLTVATQNGPRITLKINQVIK